MVALFLWACSHRASEPTEPVTLGGNKQPEVDFVEGSDEIQIVLSEAAGSADLAKALPSPDTRPLDAAAIDALLAQVDPIEPREGDRSVFSVRPGSKPPSLTGIDINESLPPSSASVAPEIPNGPLQVVRHAPEGAVPLAPHVSLTFDRPMVAVTSQDEAARTVPATLTPTPPGRWRWLGTKTLLFDADPRLPMATEFVVSVPAETRAADGSVLAQPVRFTFQTPPPEITQWWPTDHAVGLDPLIACTFNQRVAPDAILAHTTLTSADGQSVAMRLATPQEIAADETLAQLQEPKEGEHDRLVVFKAASPLAKSTSYTITVRAGAPSAEGPRTTPNAQGITFHTYSALAVVDHRCNWGKECPPTSPWMVQFNNPLDPESIVRDEIRIEPAVEGFSAQSSDNTLYVSGAFVGRTTYTLTVPASITDTFAQRLGKEQTLQFKTGPSEQTLGSGGDSMVVLDPAGGATLAMWSTNHKAVKVSIHRVAPSDHDAWLQWMRDFEYEDNRPKRLPGVSVFQGTVEPPVSQDKLVEWPIALTPYLQEGYGQFVVLVEPVVQPKGRWNRQSVYRWVQVTDIGLTAFVDGDELVGWASDLATGAPRGDVALSLTGVSSTENTAADGLAKLVLPEQHRSTPGVLVARAGADTAILPERSTPWWGESSWIHQSDLDQMLWYTADDRGLYRPGETAKIKGWLRRQTPGPRGDVQGLGNVSGVTVHYTLRDARNNEVGQGDASVSALGGFHFDLVLPADMNQGAARLLIEARGTTPADGLSTQHVLAVEEFRRPEFEVSSSASRDALTLGERTQVDLTASYYAGGGLANAPVTWSVYASPSSYTPPGWASYSFGTFSPWWERRSSASEQHIAAFSSTTDASGRQHLGLHVRALERPRPVSLRAEGTVMDVNRQAWTTSTKLMVHPASVYVGLKTERAFVEPNKPVDLSVVLVGIDGSPIVSEDIAVSFARLEWSRGAKGLYEQKEVDPESCAVHSSGKGEGTCSFVPKRGGSYRLLASARDDLGRKTESELTVWVSGAEQIPAREVTMEEIVLVPEQRDAGPGDTLRVLVQAPFFPAEGVMTLRRAGLVETKRFTMDSPTTTLDIPILDAYVPDITVQVNLVGKTARTDDEGKALAGKEPRLAHAMGALTVSVPPTGRTLAVHLDQSAIIASPGEALQMGFTVASASGTPVSGAEVAVVVADESVLALTGYKLPDPIEVFYAARGPGVSDAHLRSFVALANPALLAVATGATTPDTAHLFSLGYMSDGDSGFGARGEGHGGGGLVGADGVLARNQNQPMADATTATTKSPARKAKERSNAPQISVRTDFSALALFAPDVRTDAQGKATVSLTLPDSLTRYRIMVVAVDAEHGFGSADGAITARLPLMVRPSAPRFLNFGDQLELPVVLQNQTDAPMEIDLAIRGSNVRFVDAIGPALPDALDVAISVAGKRVTVPANDRVEVRFPAATVMSGTARFQAVGRAGTASDAATFEVPVWTPATSEAFATYGAISGPGAVQPVTAPPGAWPQFGGLQVTTSSTQLSALTDAVLYLQRYPYECNEQLASRLLGIASLKDVLSAFEADGLPSPDLLSAQVADDIARLAARQHWNGGFAFWRKGDEPWPFLSIHVANAFARAKSKGYTVPADTWGRSLSHLRYIRHYIPSDYSAESKWLLEAYALDVRRRMGDADAKRAHALYAEAGTKIGIDGLAFLLPTLHEGKLTGDVSAIVRYIGNHTTESAGTAHFVTSYSDGAHVLLHSERRADGIVLEALMESVRDDELIDKVVRGLLAHKTKGRWSNTQENAFVLMALDRYFQIYESQTPDFVARVWLGDGYAGEHTFRGRSTERSQIEVPMGVLTEHKGPQPLTIVRDGEAGRLYYRIGVTYAPKELRLAAADYGFAVERRYEAIDDSADVTRDTDGVWHIRAGARVRVQLSMATEMRRYHVALVDPLPAGLEAQNSALATTGTLPLTETAGQPYGWWWSRTWYEHENLRDERVEAFSSLLWDGVYDYSYIARATTPGRFIVPPTKAEEMYMPETFGRSATDIVVVR